ncbi:MAG: rfe [Gammaproteobacteria bacterium]|jgi:UDP-GlcNAc:undecaprenyl-phosphate GlcNAc-1-phosphate transferase|nr:rfe [Gammaproteobacteria bacterium]
MLTLYPNIIAFLICAISIWLLTPLAKRIGLIDLPSERKFHTSEVPLIGGVAIFLGFCFALLTVDISLADFRGLIAVSAMLVFIGILDDFHELSPRAKLLAQIVASILTIAWGHNQLHSLGNILFIKPLELGYGSLPITVIAVVGIINAYNMIDGIDGLASGMGLITMGFLCYFAFRGGEIYSLIILLVFVSSLLSFLCFNFPLNKHKQASVFLGDAGSMLIGFILVWFLISLSQNKQAAVRPADMLWLVSLPLYDVVGVVLRRIFQRCSPFKADRNHIHHLLLYYLKDPLKVCMVMYTLTGLCGLVAVFGSYYKIHEGFMFTGFITLFISYLIINRQLWKLTQKN